MKVWLGDYIFEPGRESILKQQSSALKAMRHEIVTSESTSPDLAVLRNLEKRDLWKAIRLKVRSPGTPIFQFVSEPMVVLPALRWRIWQRFFQERIVLGAAEESSQSFLRPYDGVLEDDFFEIGSRLTRVVMVNANKFSWISGENYSLRRAVAAARPDLDVFGADWTRSRTWVIRKLFVELFRGLVTPFHVRSLAQFAFARPVNPLGPCDSKLSTLSRYKVNLVIENSMELVTEKISDAWFAGCVPVYVGPNLDDFGIPSDLYIRANPDLVSVLKALDRALAMDQAALSSRVKDFLVSDFYRNQWSSKSAWKAVWKYIFENVSPQN